jgi:glycosyltransferase involved in cell wall biosynthesis
MLISCVCVTEKRPRFIDRAIALFNAQSYTEKELLIVDDYYDPSVVVPSRLNSDVVYFRCPRYAQGKKLDLGMRSAKGALVQKWDDDDIYCKGFLQSAIDAYQDGSVTVLRKCLLVTTDNVLRVRGGRYAGGSITLSKETFLKIGGVSDVKSDVDGDILRRCSDAQVAINPQHSYFEEYVYVRHGANTWNGMQSVLVNGEIKHMTHDEHWKSLPVYEGPKREEIVKWLQ